MNIAEKLTTIAENEPKIYEKGKTDFGYKKSVSGSYLYIDDINQNEKELDITLTSDTITDFSNIKLTVCGKNILSNWKRGAHIFSNGLYDPWSTNYLTNDYIPVKSNTEYSISVTFSEEALAYTCRIQGALYYDADKNYLSYALNNSGLTTFTTPENCCYVVFDVLFTGTTNVPVSYIVTSQLEEGEATEFEPYIATEYIPNIDGVVNITPYYPITNMFTDNTGVTINTKYYADSEKIIGELTDTIISLGGTLDV